MKSIAVALAALVASFALAASCRHDTGSSTAPPSAANDPQMAQPPPAIENSLQLGDAGIAMGSSSDAGY